MPELPEVEIVKRSLSKMINRAKFINIKIKNKNLRYKLPFYFSRYLKGQKILKISRRSKYIIFHLEKYLLLMHLGMSGKLLIKKRNNNKIFKASFYHDLNILKNHNHVYFTLNNDIILIYNDVRRFGFFKLYFTKDLKNITFLNKLGVEPLSKMFNVKYFNFQIKNKKLNIKKLLMDQTFVSGLGNIYSNEALFLSKINPLRVCTTLKINELKKLIFNIKKILKFSISKGGASIKDFKDISGKSGNFQQFFHVYGQNNKKCSRISCKGKIKKISIGQRSTFYCNKCQK